MARRTSPNSEVLSHSVTKGDYNTSPYGGYGGIYNLTLPFQGPGLGDKPPYWSPIYDRTLKSTPMRESMWASAIGIATSKVAASDWRLDGAKIKYWQDLMLSVDNDQSFVAFEEKQVRDYLLTCNGNHFEIIRTTDARGARIVGLQHLPSWRCLRTGDPDIPIIYRDRRGAWHEMQDYQVVSMADQPDADDIYFGVGHCAAERAWNAILKLSALELYVYEKISGKNPSRIYLVNANISEQQLKDAIDTSREHSNQKGLIAYMDAVIVPILDPNATASVGVIDLKGLPENFDADKERIQAMLTYADSIGLDPVELDPNLAARGRALGSGSQAQVLDDKQSGRGLVSYFKKKSYLYNEYVLPDRVTFFFASNDLVDTGRKADIFLKHVQAVRDLVGAQGTSLPIVTPEQGKQLLATAGDIPAEFLAQPLSDDESLHDDEKPSDLQIESTLPIDSKLMLTEPPAPAPAFGAKPPTNGNGNKPAAKQSFNDYLAEKAYNERVNAAEAWASHYYRNWFVMTEKELLQLHKDNMVAQAHPKLPLKAKEVTVPQPTQPQPQIIVVQPQAQAPQPITIHMPQQEKQTYQPQQITLHQEPLQLTLNIPEQPAPIVNVAPAEVYVTNEVQPSQVTLPAPIVNVAVPESQPQITVNVPTQPAPQITVQAPTSTKVLDVLRNSQGLIERVVETNGN